MHEISPPELKRLLLGDDEIALLDVREEGAFSEAHLLFAACVPFSRIELLVGDLVPRNDTPVVVVGEGEDGDLDRRALERLRGLGYADVRVLAGGVAAWQAAGFELFSGVNVPSKAFGEFVEHTCETPRLTAPEVKRMLDEGRDVVIVDARPFEEYTRMNIPSATDMPGAELAFRIHDIAPDPETFVVVNCAGRTRSIIGAQSLINAGIGNPVAALKDGTMGWHLAGFELEHGSTRTAPAPSAGGMAKALAAAERVAERFAVRTEDAATVDQWRRTEGRTTYLLDVRSPEEYAEGHLPGYRNAPGGQLVQATDQFVAVRNAWLVLADDVGVRATMTASWLLQMGWPNVYVLEGGIGSGALVTGAWEPTVLGTRGVASVTTDELAARLDAVRVVDLGPSPAYERHHIPGAVWCVRSRLAAAFVDIPADVDVVLTSPDGTLAEIALEEARGLGGHRVEALQGGTERWLADGHETEAGLVRTVGPTDDVWYKPYQHRDSQEKFMREYLSWEVALVGQIERDGTTRFRTF
ncbi:MAG: hypothetical protein F4X36_22480 [Gammaproteobacteria bacterium]|nr:hypothetical protein [Gammaproteobacteria bacterium]